MSERLEDIISFRKKKLQSLLDKGIDPFPSSTDRSHTIGEVLADFDNFNEKQVVFAGRIRSLRVMGKLAFSHIDDGTGRIQILIQNDSVGEEQFNNFVEHFDVG